MIWTLIVLCIFIVSLAIGIFVDDYYHDVIKFSGILAAVASGVVLLIMVGIIIGEHTFVDHKVAEIQAEREALVYQMDHQLFLGDALGEYNKKIIWMRNVNENPWTSWFQGDYIYEVDPIELK